MDPIVTTASAQILEIAARTTVDSVTARVRRARADHDRDATIEQMDEIINDLQRDRADLVRLAQGLEEQFVSQRLTPTEIGFISEQIIPVFEDFADEDASEAIEAVKKLLSVELLTIMQTIGFNYRQALGEPLTEIVRSQLLARLSAPAASASDAD